MQKFSIARLRWLMVRDIHEPAKMQEECFLRLEPNGNIMWTIHKELASQWEHATAEDNLKQDIFKRGNCYLVEAVKTDA